MNPEETETTTPKNEEEQVAPEATEEVAPEGDTLDAEIQDRDDKELKSALAQKDHFREKVEKTEAEVAKLQEELQKQITDSGKPKEKSATSLDVEDYIDISTALSDLDPVQQAQLAKLHKQTGQAMKDIRESEDYQLWNNGYQAKKEAEKALAPDSSQELEDRPMSLEERLKTANLADKEKILTEAGFYKAPKTFNQTNERANIGDKISTG